MIDDDSAYRLVNEAFPHIGKKIRTFWGYPEFVTLMLSLQQNDRGSPRQGFPGKVIDALMKLEEKHDREYPRLKRQILSTWHTL